MTSNDDDEERRRRLLGSFGISSRHMADELARSLRRHYDDVVLEGIPEHLRTLVERIRRRESAPTDDTPRPGPKKS